MNLFLGSSRKSTANRSSTLNPYRAIRALIIVENTVYPSDTRVLLEARALLDAGFDVHVISQANSHYSSLQEKIDGVVVHRFPVRPSSGSAIGYLREFSSAFIHISMITIRLVICSGVDVVQVCNPPDIFFPIGALIRMLGKPFIFDQHDLSPETFRTRSATFGAPLKALLVVLKLCEWLTYRTASVVIATSKSIAEISQTRGGVPCDKVFVVRNGPDATRRQRVPKDIRLLGGRPYLVCYAGRMNPQDGVDYLLRAIDWIVHEANRCDLTFALVGDGDAFDSLQLLAIALKIDKYVTFPGYVDSRTVMTYLCSADVGVAPEPTNGMNEFLVMIKVMEYMAVGLPIVAFDLKETRESARDGALYATANDPKEFGRLILKLIDNNELREQMGAYARQRVQDELAWECSRPHLIAAYRSVLGFEEHS